MKIKKIRIHNLASIEDAEVDFQGEVLRDEPLFLITGATGAGKTTILDAICLALYNDTPRFSEAAEKNVRLTDYYNAKKGKDVSQKGYELAKNLIPLNHKGQLLRRGTAEGWAELYFEADEVNYLAKWTIRRKYGRPDGKLDNPVNSLTNLNTGHVEEKSKALAEVVRVVGLNFDEFCRTTMLAQGEFTKFLQSTGKDKSAILEKLTQTGLYSELGKKIFEIKSQKQSEYEHRKQLVADITLLTEEQRVEKEAQKARMEEQVATDGRMLDDLKAKKQWLDDCKQMIGDIEQKAAMVRRMEETMQGEEYLRETGDIADYDLTAEPRAWMADAEKAKRKLLQLKDEEGAMAAQHARLAVAATCLEQRLAGDEDSLRLIGQWLQGREGDADMLDNAGTVIVRLQQVEDNEKLLEQKSKLVEETDGKLPLAEKTVTQKEEDEKNASAEVEQKNKEVEEAAQRLQKLDKAGLQEKYNNLQERKELLVKTAADINLVAVKRQQLDKAENDYKQLMEEWEHYRSEEPKLKQEEELASKLFDRAQIVFDQWHDSLDKSFKAKRATLTKGQTCPLCMQVVEHDHVADPDYDTYIKPLRDALDDCRAKLEDAKTKLLAARQMAKKAEKNVPTAKKAVENARMEFNKHDAVTREALQRLAPASMPDVMTHEQQLSLVGDLQQEVLLEIKKVRERMAVVEAEEKNLDALRKVAKKLSKAHADTRVATQVAKAGLEKLRTVRDAAAKQVEELKNSIAETLAELRQTITYNGWEEEWKADHKAFILRLKGDADKYQGEKKKKDKLEKVIAARRVVVENLAGEREAMAKSVPGWSITGDEEPEKFKTDNELAQKWSAFTTQVASWMAALEAKETERENKERDIEAFLSTHQGIDRDRLTVLMQYDKEGMERMRRRHQETEAALTREKGALGMLRKQQEQLMDSKPQMTDEQTEEWLAEKMVELSQNREQQLMEVGKLQRELQFDLENRNKYEKAIEECEQALKEWDRWKRMDDEFGSSDGSRFSRVAQSFILNHLLNHANNYLKAFSDRYQLVCEPGSLAILVKDKFSSQSPQFSKVLSGGESFMVSLSLALALAKLNTHQSSVDTLFIDEGFGSLDEGCLNTVMDTLEHLHQIGGRRVGVISHVEALNDRIRTQVRVDRVDPTRSKVVVKRV